MGTRTGDLSHSRYWAFELEEREERRRRKYTLAMVAACFVAFAFGLWNARNQWFIFDEWAYWGRRRRLLDENEYVDFFLEPHGDHLHAIVMAIWLPLDWAFGAKRYLPYVVPTIAVHCAAGYLLFAVLRRTSIRPAVAFGTAVLALLLENAAGNVSFAWQIVFVAPIALCYLGVLTLERYVTSGNRWLAVVTVASVALAVASSGVAITVTGVVGLLALLRRRYVLAALTVAIPGGAYLAWRSAYDPPTPPLELSKVDDYARYVREGIESTLEDIVQMHVPLVGWILLAAAIGAVVAGYREGDHSWPVFAATLAGAVGFYTLLATQRYEETTFGSGFEAWSPRYVHVASALMLPALAYAVDQLLDLRRWIVAPVVVVAVWALVLNATRFGDFNDPYVAVTQDAREEIAATVAMGATARTASPYAQPWGRPVSLYLGTLFHLADQDRLPCSTDADAVARAAARIRVSIPEASAVSCDHG